MPKPQTNTSQRGGSDIWFLVLLGALVVWALLGHQTSVERLEALRAELLAPRPETAAEAAVADAAERLPDLAVKPGLWRFEKSEGSIHARLDLLLRGNGTFLATAAGRVGEEDKLSLTAGGGWRIKGHTLVLTVEEGAKGFFPSSGRLAVREATDAKLVFAGEKKDIVLVEAGDLELEARKPARETESRDAGRDAFAALPYAAVPDERRLEWLMEQPLFGFIKAFLVFAVVVAGWHIGRWWWRA